MPPPVKKAADRSKSTFVKLQVWGKPKYGKTFMASTLPPEKTLFLDAEKGMLSLSDWDGTSIDIVTWPEVKNLTCWISGPSATAEPGKTYSREHYAAMVKKYGSRDWLKQFRYLFIDSTTLIGTFAFAWAKQHPSARTASGGIDTRGAYGLLATELMEWAWQLQAIQGMHVILVGGLKQLEDGDWVPLIDGSAANKMLYVFDEIVTLDIQDDEKRVLICRPGNEQDFPAGDRSGKLDMEEPANLLDLLKKIKS